MTNPIVSRLAALVKPRELTTREFDLAATRGALAQAHWYALRSDAAIADEIVTLYKRVNQELRKEQGRD